MYFYIFSLIIGWLLLKLVAIIRLWWSWRVYVKDVPLLPDNHWFFGIVHKINSFEDFINLCQRYIDKVPTKWFTVYCLFIHPVLNPVHPTTIKPFLSASNVPKNRSPVGGVYKMLLPWIGEGLLVSNGVKWERNRRLLTPAFHFDILKPYVAVFCEVTDIFLDKLKLCADSGKSVDVFPYVTRLTLHALLRCMLSYDEETIQDTAGHHPYVEAIHRLKLLLIARMVRPHLYPNWMFNRSSIGKEFLKESDYVHKFSEKFIKARKLTRKESSCTEEKRHLDFLDILLSARDENGVGLTDQEIRDEVDTFVFEGHDTTASAVSWVLHSLAKYPEYQAQVRQEVLEALDGKQEPGPEDLSKLPFTTCVIKESMRMNTPVPAFTRVLKEPITVEGVTFPQGQSVDFMIHLMHHNPEVWENHWEFQPERFFPENIEGKDPFSFIPFSAGQRNCIGQHFAMNEIKVIVCKVLKRYEISTDPQRAAEPFPEVIMGAKDGIYLHFKQR